MREFNRLGGVQAKQGVEGGWDLNGAGTRGVFTELTRVDAVADGRVDWMFPPQRLRRLARGCGSRREGFFRQEDQGAGSCVRRRVAGSRLCGERWRRLVVLEIGQNTLGPGRLLAAGFVLL